jgi:hypothetical protein
MSGVISGVVMALSMSSSWRRHSTSRHAPSFGQAGSDPQAGFCCGAPEARHQCPPRACRPSVAVYANSQPKLRTTKRTDTAADAKTLGIDAATKQQKKKDDKADPVAQWQCFAHMPLVRTHPLLLLPILHAMRGAHDSMHAACMLRMTGADMRPCVHAGCGGSQALCQGQRVQATPRPGVRCCQQLGRIKGCGN